MRGDAISHVDTVKYNHLDALSPQSTAFKIKTLRYNIKYFMPCRYLRLLKPFSFLVVILWLCDYSSFDLKVVSIIQCFR